jgi:hypothetical protein
LASAPKFLGDTDGAANSDHRFAFSPTTRHSLPGRLPEACCHRAGTAPHGIRRVTDTNVVTVTRRETVVVTTTAVSTKTDPVPITVTVRLP